MQHSRLVHFLGFTSTVLESPMQSLAFAFSRWLFWVGCAQLLLLHSCEAEAASWQSERALRTDIGASIEPSDITLQ